MSPHSAEIERTARTDWRKSRGFSAKGDANAGRPHTVGFRRIANARADQGRRAVSIHSHDLAVRPHGRIPRQSYRGRLILGAIFCAILVFGCHAIWNACFRYQAYGMVSGRVVDVSSEWPGTVQAIHVRDGDWVTQGQPLFTLVDDSVEKQTEQLKDELQMAVHSLNANKYAARLAAEASNRAVCRAEADHHQLAAELERETTQRDVLEARLERLESLLSANASSVKTSELEELRISLAGQRRHVETLVDAVAAMKAHSRSDLDHEQGASLRIQSQQARIELLESKLARLRHRRNQGVIRSPAEGRVVRKCCFTGEFAQQGQPVMQILEDGTLEVCLYLSHEDASSIVVGRELDVKIGTRATPLTCQVTRVGTHLERAPKELERHYSHPEQLLAVYVELPLELRTQGALPLGTTARLARDWKDSKLAKFLTLAWLY